MSQNQIKHENLLFLGTPDDKEYLPRIKQYFKGKKVFLDLRPVSTVAEVSMYCKNATRNITGVLSTSIPLLQKLSGNPKATLDQYAGSYFLRDGIEYVFTDPIEQVFTVTYGGFLIEKWISKLVEPESWVDTTEFKWRIADTAAKRLEAEVYLSTCDILSADIETFKEGTMIRCIGYTGLQKDFTSFSYVIPLDSMEALETVRRINANKVPKIFQNGKYDIAYLSRYNAVPYNYLWDTAALFHCWYAELPKDLGFLQAFFVRNAANWKALADTTDLEQYYLYNAKDTWATLHVFLAWIMQAPQWAKDNYTQEFPVQFPAHLCEMTGVKRDESKLATARVGIDSYVTKRNASLDRILGTQGFNVNSAPQMKQLFQILGLGHYPSRDDKHMAKAAYAHPINARIVELIRGVPKTDVLEDMGIRALRKVKSTNLRTDEDSKKEDDDKGSKDYKGRILYSLNPHGTDTGRLASKSHHFWCGFNIQNVPAGVTVKQTIIADDDFYFAECDLEQAEARDVAHISGDTKLITAVTGTRDFHSFNASQFFGVPYEDIYDDVTKKAKNKPLRNLSKRVNHGANYNMGPDILVDTMGEKAIYEAGRLLNLPQNWVAREIAKYLLERFDTTYPVIRGKYHAYLVECIVVTKLLVGATGWTRYCFGDPRKSKPILNSYVAHPSQSLNAMKLNKAFMKVFYNIALHPKHGPNFKLCAQIHDSILFQYRVGHEYLCEMVRELMEIPLTVKGADGISRTYTVPAAIKMGTKDKPAKYWSETE